MSNTRLVYSTESGRICPECEHSVKECICRTKEKSYKGDGVVRIRLESKGRKGKTVTSVSGIPLDEDKLKQLAKILKARCGSGGSSKDGIIVIQGDHKKTLLEEIKKQGYTVKLVGG